MQALCCHYILQIRTLCTLPCFSIWKHCCRFDSQTELMTHFDVETHWQCSLGTKRGRRGQRRAHWGLLSFLLAGSRVLQRGFRGAVIHRDVRDWLPLGWICNMTDHNGRGRIECWLDFYTREQASARGFYTALNVVQFGCICITHIPTYTLVCIFCLPGFHHCVEPR